VAFSAKHSFFFKVCLTDVPGVKAAIFYLLILSNLDLYRPVYVDGVEKVFDGFRQFFQANVRLIP
jgi:hypothetical protein